MIRVRWQHFPPGAKKAHVHIISVDQFTRLARKVGDPALTERQHLSELLRTGLNSKSMELNLYALERDGHRNLFWLEKP